MNMSTQWTRREMEIKNNRLREERSKDVEEIEEGKRKKGRDQE